MGAVSVVALVALSGCGGAGTTTTTTAPPVTAPPVTVTIDGPIDVFGPPNTTLVLGGAVGEPAWKAVAGVWGVVDQQAYVRSPVAGRNLAVVDVGQADGSAQVTLASAANQAGLVFRYQDPRDYWAVVDVPYYATWALDLVQGGRARVVASTGLSSVQSGTQVGVVLNGPTIQLVIDSRVMRTVTDPALDQATMVGMTVDGRDAQSARFADFHFPAPVPPSTSTSTTTKGRAGSGQGRATSTTSSTQISSTQISSTSSSSSLGTPHRTVPPRGRSTPSATGPG